MAVHTSKTAVTELMRVAWRTVGAIITRVVAEARAAKDPFDGLRRIGIKGWLAWACRCRITAFVKLGQRIRKNLPGIRAALTHGLSNALVESTNTKLRLLTRMAFGFKSPEALVALGLLDRGGYCPPLPGRGD